MIKQLRVHDNKRYLMTGDGEPFFYLADTAWELFHKLSLDETGYYLDIRQAQGFNVVQAAALAEDDGLRRPNAYGRVPLHKTEGLEDPKRPDLTGPYSYWEHMDRVIKEAEKRGIYIALLPTWGDKFYPGQGKGPKIFTPENAGRYGEWIGRRYREQKNIIWMLGGDRPLETVEHEAVVDAMAEGIRHGDGGEHLMTFHPYGGTSSADYVGGKEYIDFHTVQSGHTMGSYESYLLLKRTREAQEKPFLDAEPRYEDHPACFTTKYGYNWNETDLRQNTYWALMEGVCGNTYGNHCVWYMNREKGEYFQYEWKEALDHPGAWQARYAKQLRESRDYFSFRPATELVEEEEAVMGRVAAGRGDHYAYCYSPLGLPMRVHVERFSGEPVAASWFNPRNGHEEVISVVPGKETLFVPPTSGKGCDWVLVLEHPDQRKTAEV